MTRRGWEQYQNCRAEDVPPGIRWDASDFSPNGYDVYYGGPSSLRETFSWGAPYRRIINLKTRAVQHARYRKTTAPKEERETA